MKKPSKKLYKLVSPKEKKYEKRDQKTKQSKTKQSKTKQSKTKQSKTKQNKVGRFSDRYGNAKVS